jgi:hypothetical protein
MYACTYIIHWACASESLLKTYVANITDSSAIVARHVKVITSVCRVAMLTGVLASCHC